MICATKASSTTSPNAAAPGTWAEEQLLLSLLEGLLVFFPLDLKYERSQVDPAPCVQKTDPQGCSKWGISNLNPVGDQYKGYHYPLATD